MIYYVKKIFAERIFSMKKMSLGLFSVVLLLSLIALPAFGYVGAGDKMGDLQFQAPVTPEGASYLGVPAGQPFKLSQVKAPYVLLEVFATGCSHCYAQAPVMNNFFNLVNKEGQIKVIGLAAGDSPDNVLTWKKSLKVPFALVPDPDNKVTGKLNIMGTPTAILLETKTGDVKFAHAGEFKDPAAFLNDLKGFMK
jgi:thiol-disulfide isomerase/thioredoxin